MELHVRGRNVPVTDALEAHAEKRMQKLGMFMDQPKQLFGLRATNSITRLLKETPIRPLDIPLQIPRYS